MQPSRFSTLHEWLAWLESLHPKEIDLGLTRIKRVAESMGLLSLPSTIITVAGTNGKGSFVKALNALLLNSNQSVGAFTSPHLLQYNERIEIDGAFASDTDICEAFAAIDFARGDTSLTYFEFGALAALYLFKKHRVDFCILEVGLGGRLDAINIIDADICVITAIDLDHQAWLGSDREVIGREKAGILREKRPFICVDENIPESVLEQAKLLSCDTFYLGKQIQIHGNRLTCVALLKVQNSYLQENVALTLNAHKLPMASLAAAFQAYLLLDIGREAAGFKEKPAGAKNLEQLGNLLEQVSLPGRFEQVDYQRGSMIFDVAHNPQAATYLAKNLERIECRDAIAIFTCMRDKDLMEICSPLRGLISTWVCVEVSGFARARSSKEIASELSGHGFNAIDAGDPQNGLAMAEKIRQDIEQKIVVLGSFFLVAEMKEVLAQL